MTTQTTRVTTVGLPGTTWTSTGHLGRDLVSLEGFGGTVISCTAGLLWLTIEGDLKDYILTPGKTVYIPSTGKVLLSGTGSYTCLLAPEVNVS